MKAFYIRNQSELRILGITLLIVVFITAFLASDIAASIVVGATTLLMFGISLCIGVVGILYPAISIVKGEKTP